MGSIYYFTCNDAPTSIFVSQVFEVKELLAKEFNIDVTVISFVSIRKYIKLRKWYKEKCPGSIVLPVFPKVENWRNNKYLLRLLKRFIGQGDIIARGPFAAAVAVLCKNQNEIVIYDGRGAVWAEEYEYGVYGNHNDNILSIVKEVEAISIHQSDYRLAVSQKLIDHWKSNFGYKSENHLIIPCTLTYSFINPVNSDLTRQKLALKESDIVLLYAGSVAGWQLPDEAISFIEKKLEEEDVKIIFLTKKNEKIDNLNQKFPSKVLRFWVDIREVYSYMSIADYGILIREHTVTNEVASPVKFGEYLYAGLKIIISEKLGDCTPIVKDNNCGYIYTELEELKLKKPTNAEKENSKRMANELFSKKSKTILSKYKQLINILNDKNETFT